MPPMTATAYPLPRTAIISATATITRSLVVGFAGRRLMTRAQMIRAAYTAQFPTCRARW
jgi:hypothetical protein